MTKQAWFKALVGITSLGLSGIAPAPTPPESYVLLTAKNEANPIDPKMEEWFRQYADNPSPFDLEPAAFAEFARGQDVLTKALLNLRYYRTKGRAQEEAFKVALKEARAIAESKDENFKRHLLYPYLLEEVLRVPRISSEDSAPVENLLRQLSEKSCAQRKSLLKEIESTETVTVELARAMLARVDTYRSRNFRQDALRKILNHLKKDEHEALAQELYVHMRPYPRLQDDFKWVKEVVEAGRPPVEKGEPFVSYDRANEQAARRQCAEASTSFEGALKLSSKLKSHLKIAESTALKIESCFRTKGQAARMAFLTASEKPLEAAFGFSGREVSLRRQGLIHWGEDRFDEAREIFRQVLAEAKNRKLKAIEARTLNTFARIEENAGELEAALRYYEEYAQGNPKGEFMEDTLTSLVLLYSLQGQPEKAWVYANRIIEEESVKRIDERSTSALSFGLYWGGRLNYDMGNTEKAQELWRRVASEYYSSFYGAIGHYTLEKVLGKSLILQPVRANPFNAPELYKVFADASEQRIVERAIQLLALGLKDEASCEVVELSAGKNDDQKLFLKSLMLYAAGDWFEAIKLYGNLPRSFRHTLPGGSERLLFPRAYTESVLKYSEKLGVDPDYVFAIIRQESVFNPRARSPVGASGLMQLMPATATMESKRLRKGYLSVEDKKLVALNEIAKKIYDPETNLALGVHHVFRLMNEYKSPIFVLTAYNASPQATARWRKKIPTDDVLAFIERIPYRETRAYVKLVLRNYFYYKRWYQGPNEKLAHLEFLNSKLEKKKPDENVQSVDVKF